MIEWEMKPTPRVVQTLRRAENEAKALGHDYVGTEHVLLALLADRHGIAGSVLHKLGVAESAEQRVRAIMSSPPYLSQGD